MLPVAPIELAELLFGASQADLETFDLAEPAFRLGLGNSGDQVVADLGKPCPLGWIRPEERASDTSLTELAVCGREPACTPDQVTLSRGQRIGTIRDSGRVANRVVGITAATGRPTDAVRKPG
ncbi:hypothetical protein GCM10009576_024930 [Streptomyces rhizosphaericus]|uniref:Uncharacterized protein n=2 Tax=Streptomyces rhizosphaericus TaxID=114699 RepID=A0ABN1S6F8_9ACTN